MLWNSGCPGHGAPTGQPVTAVRNAHVVSTAPAPTSMKACIHLTTNPTVSARSVHRWSPDVPLITTEKD